MERHDWNARLAALRSGDMAAFEEIYEELKTPAYTVILRILRDEVTNGGRLRIPFFGVYVFLLKYVAPIGIASIFVNELIR